MLRAGCAVAATLTAPLQCSQVKTSILTKLSGAIWLSLIGVGAAGPAGNGLYLARAVPLSSTLQLVSLAYA